MTLFVQRVEKDDGLDCFTQAHFICKDDVGTTAPAVSGPIEAFELVRVQSKASRDPGRLHLVFFIEIFAWLGKPPLFATAAVVQGSKVFLLIFVRLNEFLK